MLFIKIGFDKHIRINYHDLIFVKAEKDYCRFFKKNGLEVLEYTSYMTLKSVLEKLPSNTFMQVHKSYIVNFRHVSEIKNVSTRGLDLTIGKDIVPVSDTYKLKLLSNLNIA